MGLCGDDGQLLKAEKLVKKDGKGEVSGPRAGGRVTEVNVDLLTLLEADYVPVVASVGVGADGRSYNINADTVAGALGAALQCREAHIPDGCDGTAARCIGGVE